MKRTGKNRKYLYEMFIRILNRIIFRFNYFFSRILNVGSLCRLSILPMSMHAHTDVLALVLERGCHYVHMSQG